MIIRVGGFDPSLRNWGLAKGGFDVDTANLEITGIRLQETEKGNGKTIRKSSDDLRRASLLHVAAHQWIADCAAVFAEIPSGSQSASGLLSNGVCIGVLSGVGIIGDFKGRLIQVSPAEVKMAACGSKNASKDEMIEWAMERWPDLPWFMHRGKPQAKNEHLADACATINAGVQTDEFKSIVQIVRATQGSSVSSLDSK